MPVFFVCAGLIGILAALLSIYVGRDLEQAIVEQVGGDAGNRRNLGEARLNERDLVGCHGAWR